MHPCSWDRRSYSTRATLRGKNGGIDADAIRAQIASRLHRVPRYRQKIAWIPVTRRPVWIDDEEFDLDHHVRHTSLPRPGSAEQLKRLTAQIMGQALDLARPLWEMHIVEGVEGRRFALILKVHHSMADGVSGIDLMTAILSLRPEGRPAESLPFTARPSPSRFELFWDEAARRITRPVGMVRDVASLLAQAAAAPEGVLASLRALSGLIEGTLSPRVSAPFNRPIGAQRRVGWLTMEREQIEGIRRSLGGSLNDVVLTVVTGAVRRYLERRKIAPRTSPFRVMTPVSVRAKDQNGALGNRVSAWIVDLPVGEPDPREQLRHIHLATRELKESKEPIGAAVLTAISEWSYSSLLISVTARHVTKLLPCNLVVTNIPGPQSTVYLLGAALREAFPLVPLTDGLGLNIGLLSYDGKLCWGFSADYDIVPDLDVFVRETEEAAAELARSSASAGRTSASERTRLPNLPRQSSHAPD